MQALIVEDDIALARVLSHILKREGYHVDVTHDGKSGLERASSYEYDVIIFDVRLPRMNGREAVEALRRRGINTPVLMLTALGEIPDKISGLDCGADAYMSKPFEMPELLARLRALTRRKTARPEHIVQAGDLILHADTQSLSCGAEDIQLSHKEFAFADVLISNYGNIVPRATIIQKVWDAASDIDGSNVDAYVSMLRRKLRFLGSRMQIKAQRSVGYQLIDSDQTASRMNAAHTTTKDVT